MGKVISAVIVIPRSALDVDFVLPENVVYIYIYIYNDYPQDPTMDIAWVVGLA